MSDQEFGKIVQVMGPVVDVEFTHGKLPSIYNALKLKNHTLGKDAENLTLEVSLHLGDNVVRTIAMDSTDGLCRGESIFSTVAFPDSAWKPLQHLTSRAAGVALP